MRFFILIIAVIISKCRGTEEEEDFAWDGNITLADNSPMVVHLMPNTVLTIHANVSSDVEFVVTQVHSQKNDVTLSMKDVIKYGTSKYGRDVGVITTVSGTSNLTWFLFSNSTTQTDVLVHLTYLRGGVPLPGGCNEEFSLENDANLDLIVHATKTDVLFQWSNSVNTQGVFPDCEDKVYKTYLEYDLYVNYMEGGDFTEGTYFSVMEEMLTAADVSKHGTKLKTIKNQESMKSIGNITSYKQQGVIYTIVVRDTHTGAMSAYIPAATYACNLLDDDSCEHKDIGGIILSTIGAIIGGFLCFFGHRYFRIENFVFGFLIFAIITFQIIGLETEISLIGSLSLAGIFGLLGGALLLSFWWNCGIPIINVLNIGLVAGYIISCIVFYTPFANLTYWDSPFNYGATFACGVLLIPVILLFFTRFLNIFSCALVGSYAIVVALDTYLGSGMRYIVLNAIRHGTDRDYVHVTVSGPFTVSEIALTVVWVVLFLAGLIFQLVRERKKAPFPPCPRQLGGNRDLRTLLRHSTQTTRAEREPLITGENRANYGTSPEVTASSAGEVSEEEVINKPRIL